MREYSGMTTIGLVLSAGGFSGAAHHSGVLDALSSVTGWDSRTSDVVVGTSAGSLIAVSLRAGISPHDLACYYTDDTPRPMVAVTGIIPEGQFDGSSFAERTSQIHPDPWPEKPTWLCALDLDSGKRVVFGRDDVEVDVGTAVQASSAIPGRFIPVNLNGRRYIDGGVHSLTNADLLAPLQLDLVIISSSSTLTGSHRNSSLSVAWNSRTLQKEIEQIRSNGTEVLTFEPTTSDLLARNELESSKEAAEDIFRRSKTSAIARLAKPQSSRARELLEKSLLQI